MIARGQRAQCQNKGGAWLRSRGKWLKEGGSGIFGHSSSHRTCRWRGVKLDVFGARGVLLRPEANLFLSLMTVLSSMGET